MSTNQTVATAFPGLFIVSLRSFTLSANEPFTVRRPEYADGSEAPMVNTESCIAPSGQCTCRLEIAGSVRLFVNDHLVRDIPDLQDEDDEVTL